MKSRNILRLGVTVGHLRIHVDGKLEETLTILYKQNGRKSFSISKNPNSRLSNKTSIANILYDNIPDLENYVTKQVKNLYHTSWYNVLIGRPKVEVKYNNNKKSGVEIAEERSRKNRPGLEGECA